ncbi:MAG: hypothetical protein IPH45_09215 [Bacteroidales bacterium]|nr:hypothetical protein [Bacteroidales bacterium]
MNGIAASPCTDVNDQMILTIDPTPVANAGPDVSVCQGAFIQLPGLSSECNIARGDQLDRNRYR